MGNVTGQESFLRVSLDPRVYTKRVCRQEQVSKQAEGRITHRSLQTHALHLSCIRLDGVHDYVQEVDLVLQHRYRYTAFGLLALQNEHVFRPIERSIQISSIAK